MKAIASNGAEIKTGDEVLVRDSKNCDWIYCYFSHTNKNKERKYVTSRFECEYCIPYKGNEDLVGTTKNFVKPIDYRFGAKVKAQLINGETVIGVVIGFKDPLYRVAINNFKDDDDCIGDTHWTSEIEYIE